MPQTPHVEKHFTGRQTIRDIVIGMSDGLTAPFALAAGLSGAVANSHIVVTAGLAEIAAAGRSPWGLGGYLAAKSGAEHYASERAREERETIAVPEAEVQEVVEIFEAYGVTAQESAPVIAALRQRPARWVDLMMSMELGLEKPDPRRGLISALTVGGAYIVGGSIPLSPYVFLPGRPKCAAVLRHRHPGGVARLRYLQGPLYGHCVPAQRPADTADRWLSSRRGFRDRQAYLVKVHPEPPATTP